MSVAYQSVIGFLESLQIMPKTMPGLDKVKKALIQCSWWKNIDPHKVIVVAGTNGKGTTCAALEALLLDAGMKVGFYSSPHLVSTTERIRINGENISEEEFVIQFQICEKLIENCELSHFEALTLMAAQSFFGTKGRELDFVILEVGLGGTFDATNAFPHKYSVITKLGYDHINILGTTLFEIAGNKFGIVTQKGIVVHHPLPREVLDLKARVQKETNSNWIEADSPQVWIKHDGNIPVYGIEFEGERIPIGLLGYRACENIMTALSLFRVLGFDPLSHTGALLKINWRGRMHKHVMSSVRCPVYLSGDHNEQGVLSLIEIIRQFKYKKIHFIVGIGAEKQAEPMLAEILNVPDSLLYLTVTPFKGRRLHEYPSYILNQAAYADENLINVFEQVSKIATNDDLCIVTGSLYLVGEVLKLFPAE